MFPGVFVILCLIVIVFGLRNMLTLSERYRQNHYYNLTTTDIEEIVHTPQNCWYTTGMSFRSGDKARIYIKDQAVHIDFESKESIILKLSDIKKTGMSGISWLLIFPSWSKDFALFNDGRIGIFFGEKQWEKGQGTELPYKWMPRGKEVRAADRIAIAFRMWFKQNLLK